MVAGGLLVAVSNYNDPSADKMDKINSIIYLFCSFHDKNGKFLKTWNRLWQKEKNKKKNYMANVGIEPKTFALLARRSNQLS